MILDRHSIGLVYAEPLIAKNLILAFLLNIPNFQFLKVALTAFAKVTLKIEFDE